MDQVKEPLDENQPLRKSEILDAMSISWVDK